MITTRLCTCLWFPCTSTSCLTLSPGKPYFPSLFMWVWSLQAIVVLDLNRLIIVMRTATLQACDVYQNSALCLYILTYIQMCSYFVPYYRFNKFKLILIDFHLQVLRAAGQSTEAPQAQAQPPQRGEEGEGSVSSSPNLVSLTPLLLNFSPLLHLLLPFMVATQVCPLWLLSAQSLGCVTEC